jgi:hypothetical protein
MEKITLRKMMAAFFMLLCCASVYAQEKIRVAVYMTGNNQTSDISQVVGMGLTDVFSMHGNFIATERTSDFLQTIRQEHTFQQSGAVDNSQIAEIGKKSGVRYVCVSEVFEFSTTNSSNIYKKNFLTTARFIDVETATIVGSAYINTTETVGISDAQSLARELISDFVRRDKNQTNKQKAAIYIPGESEYSSVNNISRIMQQILIDAVSKTPHTAVTERTNSFLESLNKELGQQYSGEVRDDQLVKLGFQAGVRYVITLKIAANIVNVRLIDVVSGDILLSRSQPMSDVIYDLEDLQKPIILIANELDRFLGGNKRAAELDRQEKMQKKQREEQEEMQKKYREEQEEILKKYREEQEEMLKKRRLAAKVGISLGLGGLWTSNTLNEDLGLEIPQSIDKVEGKTAFIWGGGLAFILPFSSYVALGGEINFRHGGTAPLDSAKEEPEFKKGKIFDEISFWGANAPVFLQVFLGDAVFLEGGAQWNFLSVSNRYEQKITKQDIGGVVGIGLAARGSITDIREYDKVVGSKVDSTFFDVLLRFGINNGYNTFMFLVRYWF